MREHGIAHRDLRRANVIVDADGAPWLIDFGFAEVAASDRALATDLAQLLVALGLAVGATRTVDTAVAGARRRGGRHRAPPPAARRARRRDPRRPASTTASCSTSCAARSRPRRRRRRPRSRSSSASAAASSSPIATLALATYFLIPQFGNVGDIADQVGDAQWAWFVPVMVMRRCHLLRRDARGHGLGEPTAAVGRRRSSRRSRRRSPASSRPPASAAWRSTRASCRRPASIPPSRSRASGSNFVAGVVVHIGMLLIFAVWAGRDAFGSISLPDPTVALYGLAAVAVFAAISFAIPWVRHQIARPARADPAAARSAASRARCATRPRSRSCSAAPPS